MGIEFVLKYEPYYDSTLRRIHVQQLSFVNLLARIFETVSFSPSLAQSWNKEEEKERVEIRYRVAGMWGATVLLLGK
jgi:hypothetical protein